MDFPVIRGPESLPSTAQTANLPIPVKKFYQGEPLALGITQIFIGIIGIIFGILINIAEDDLICYIFIAIPYWSGILYIISGSLAVAAARNPKIPLVKGMLAMNVISSIAAGIGIICLFVTLSYNLVFYVRHLCNHDDTEAKEKCYETMMSSFNILNGIIIILTVFTFLEFCITISIASFGCKMLCRNAFPETIPRCCDVFCRSESSKPWPSFPGTEAKVGHGRSRGEPISASLNSALEEAPLRSLAAQIAGLTLRGEGKGAGKPRLSMPFRRGESPPLSRTGDAQLRG